MLDFRRLPLRLMRKRLESCGLPLRWKAKRHLPVHNTINASHCATPDRTKNTSCPHLTSPISHSASGPRSPIIFTSTAMFRSAHGCLHRIFLLALRELETPYEIECVKTHRKGWNQVEPSRRQVTRRPKMPKGPRVCEVNATM